MANALHLAERARHRVMADRVRDAAEQSGYKTAVSFRQRFNQAFQTSPREWRKRFTLLEQESLRV
ncbi:hypothetical protein [Xanthomonas campestris]|uniref:hypothetical protein n=1 Tax=Xanthomonas TaxID=338 RepID=UPI001E620F5D|nr:hypothetical protein [Xanthomonas campestris]MCC5088618.1 hypothetical protein [Xanthomonas campestris]